MSKKEILKPFDIEKAKNGAKIRDSKGRNVRIVCFDALNLVWGISYPIVAQIEEEKGKERTQLFQANGTSEQPSDNATLFIVEEVEEPDRWIDRMGGKVKGWCLAYKGEAVLAFSSGKEKDCWKSIFAKKKQAQAAAAAAQISQIMANDKRFGGVITNEEWKKESVKKFVICREKDELRYVTELRTFVLLAFHTAEQRALFMQENEELIKQYYML